MVERGTHTELLTLGGLYASLYYTQFKKERQREEMKEGEGEMARDGIES